MRRPHTEAEIRGLLKKRPRETHTYEVSREVLERIPLDTKEPLRVMDEAETQELARYLEVDAAELAGPFRVVDAKCPECGRQITFLDFVKTAVDGGHHDRSRLRDVLTGRAGAWVTVRGRDGGRPVNCAQCGSLVRMSDYSEYSSSDYAYA